MMFAVYQGVAVTYVAQNDLVEAIMASGVGMDIVPHSHILRFRFVMTFRNSQVDPQSRFEPVTGEVFRRPVLKSVPIHPVTVS